MQITETVNFVLAEFEKSSSSFRLKHTGYFVCTHADILPGPPFRPHVRGWAKRSILEPPGPEPPLLHPPVRYTRVSVGPLRITNPKTYPPPPPPPPPLSIYYPHSSFCNHPRAIYSRPPRFKAMFSYS